MNEGLSVKEIQRLCDVHAAVFRESLEQVKKPETIPGHPVHTFKEENKAIEKNINENLRPALEDFKRNGTQESILKLLGNINLLMDIDKHYSRKENLLFPYLEKYGITGPPSVMWGMDDEIRELLKSTIRDLKEYNESKKGAVEDKLNKLINKIIEMIFKRGEHTSSNGIRYTYGRWVGKYFRRGKATYVRQGQLFSAIEKSCSYF